MHEEEKHSGGTMEDTKLGCSLPPGLNIQTDAAFLSTLITLTKIGELLDIRRKIDKLDEMLDKLQQETSEKLEITLTSIATTKKCIMEAGIKVFHAKFIS